MAKAKVKVAIEIPETPAKSAGEVYDNDGKLIGRYLYLRQGQQETLDKFCRSWLETYDHDQRFFLTIDLETQGLDPITQEILLFSISWDGKRAVLFRPQDFDLTLFLEVLRTIPIANQNTKFDAKWFYQKYGILINIIFCTMVGAQLGWAGCFPQRRFSLDILIEEILIGYRITKEVRNTFIGWPVEKPLTLEQVEYAARDSMLTTQLIYPIRKRLDNLGLSKIFDEVEMPLLQMMVKVELRGVLIDEEKAQALYAEKEKELVEIYGKIDQEIQNIPNPPKFPSGKFKPTSWQQILAVMDCEGIKLPNTAAETLSSFHAKTQNQLLSHIIDYKEVAGQISKTLKAWLENHIHPVTHCIHGNFYTMGTVTGRFTCVDPNMMQVPGDFRPMIIARPGYKILTADMSQFEIRACAALTQEETWIASFKEREKLLPDVRTLAAKYGFLDADEFCKKAGNGLDVTPAELDLVSQFIHTDVHRQNIALILNKDVEQVTSLERKIGKTLGYAVLYGAAAPRVQEQLAKEKIYNTIEECDAFIQAFFDKLPKVKALIEDTHKMVMNPGYISTFMGRKRFFNLPPKWQARLYEKARNDAFREAVNCHFQMANVDAIKIAMVEMDRVFAERWAANPPQLLLTVHDEVVIEVPDGIEDEVVPCVESILIDSGLQSINYGCPVECSRLLTTHWAK
jgi:DNA polymerase-1